MPGALVPRPPGVEGGPLAQQGSPRASSPRQYIPTAPVSPRKEVLSPSRRPVWNLTYEPRGNFSEQVASEFEGAHYSVQRLRRPGTAAPPSSLRPPPYRAQPRQDEGKVGAPLDVGDTVLVSRRTSSGVASAYDALRPVVGRVVQRVEDHRFVVEIPGQRGTEEFAESDLKRQQSLFSAWYPSDAGGATLAPNPSLVQQATRGLLPDPTCSAFTHKLREGGGEKTMKLRWQEKVIKQYEGTNMQYIVSALSSHATGDSGVLFKRKLDDCLTRLDALPPEDGVHAAPPGTVSLKDKALDKLMQVFGRGVRYGDKVPDKIAREDPFSQDTEVVIFDDLVAGLNSVVNGVGKERFLEACFALYENNEYIHMEDLKAGRALRQQDKPAKRAEGCNSFQVRRLLELFDVMLREEEDKYLMQKAGKKKGKKLPPRLPGKIPPGEWNAVLPKRYAIPRHMSREDFCRFMSKDGELVAAFLPVCFELLHTTYYESKAGMSDGLVAPRSKLPALGLQRRRWSDTHDPRLVPGS
eukprot:TRINITY_DN22611_c0_g1_i1.p1 TRINITY_DN22611_c0_g1~~TRINITY_DN22611_c0_g1_i1.p1  ORF type:complete len:545 (+),score=142.79 TRINITY_DN22611_c0_g1_i1:66-1637(+)